MKKNKMRDLLKSDRPTIGTHIHSTWPSIIEIVGHAGMFDYVEFVAEYAPYDLHDLDNMGRAAELHDLGTMIKIDRAGRTFTAQRAIGSGFQSVLFADCMSAADARECVRAVRADTPEQGGYHGAASRRFTYMSYGGGPDYVQMLEDIVVVLMIEKKTAVDELDEILSIEGVDMIQWGGTDYSMNVGKAGGRLQPEIKAIETQVFKKALEAGIPPRAEIGNVDQARHYLDMGVRHFSMGTDIAILYSWLKEQGEALRREIEA